jgi:hypothetical protein
MNAGIFLVTAVHYVATAAEVAIAASAAEKPRHPRADRPPSPGQQNQAHRSARRAHGLERAANRSETGLRPCRHPSGRLHTLRRGGGPGRVLVHALVIERGSFFLVHSLELLCRLSQFDLFLCCRLGAFANYRMFCLSELVTQNDGRLNRNWIRGSCRRISVTQEQLHVLQEYFCMLILGSVTRIGVYD